MDPEFSMQKQNSTGICEKFTSVHASRRETGKNTRAVRCNLSERVMTDLLHTDLKLTVLLQELLVEWKKGHHHFWRSASGKSPYETSIDTPFYGPIFRLVSKKDCNNLVQKFSLVRNVEYKILFTVPAVSCCLVRGRDVDTSTLLKRDGDTKCWCVEQNTTMIPRALRMLGNVSCNEQWPLECTHCYLECGK